MAPIVDTHVHLFEPQRHPFGSDTPYVPLPSECASLEQLTTLLRDHGVGRAVLVAPTVGYGYNLSPLIDGLRRAGEVLTGCARLRGDEDDAELQALDLAGVRGVRLDLRHDSPAHVRMLQESGAIGRWARQGWFVQVQADVGVWLDVADQVADWPVRLVIDHCGLPDPGEGLQQPGFGAVCALASRSNTWLKLSGPFRFSREAWPHPDTDVYATTLLRRFGPQRCVWGSDWPFVRTGLRLSYAQVLERLSRWVPDEYERQQVLRRSPWTLLQGLEGSDA